MLHEGPPGDGRPSSFHWEQEGEKLLPVDQLPEQPEGRTTEELAGELGVASNSVHQRLRRLRIRLAAALGPGAMPFEPEAPAPRGRSLRHG